MAGLLLAAATGKLAGHPPLRWRDQAAVVVVLAAAGYPGTPRSGDVISGLESAGAEPGAWVLHAGTRQADDGSVVSAGGRVLSVVGTGVDLEEARRVAYAALGRLRLAGGHCRTDIATAERLPTLEPREPQ